MDYTRMSYSCAARCSTYIYADIFLVLCSDSRRNTPVQLADIWFSKGKGLRDQKHEQNEHSLKLNGFSQYELHYWINNNFNKTKKKILNDFKGKP